MALGQNEFVLHDQPKVKLGTGRGIGTEALIRGQQRGLLSATVFLPEIEGHPWAVEVGEWVYSAVEHHPWGASIEMHLQSKRVGPHPCHFGPRLDGEAPERNADHPTFQTIEPLHLQVPTRAKETMDLHLLGRNADVMDKLGKHPTHDSMLEQLQVQSIQPH